MPVRVATAMLNCIGASKAPHEISDFHFGWLNRVLLTNAEVFGSFV
jgi:hypothetical protein